MIITDALAVTVPEECGDLLERIRPLLDVAGFFEEYVDKQKVLLRAANGGLVRWEKRFNVWRLSASGAACGRLREVGCWSDYLSEIGATPHRVTRLDAAYDVPQDAAPEVRRIRRKGARGLLQLTRKAVSPHHVDAHLSTRFDGVETGTVYVGSKQAEVRLVVYDKQHERIMAGASDPGPLTRYELRLKSGVGVTLRDAAEPSAVFWHHVSRSVLRVPAGVPVWESMALGFELPRPEGRTALARFLGRFEGNGEVAALAKLAAELGPFGEKVLLSKMAEAFRGAQGALSGPVGASGLRGRAQPAETANDACVAAGGRLA